MAVLKTVSVFALLVCVAFALPAKQQNYTNLGVCPDQGGCSVNGAEGACVSVSAGCCSGGTTTAGYCPGSSDIECCTNAPCSTPQGSGTCMNTGSCSGTSVAGYCAGPSDLECCVGGGPNPPSGCTVGSIASSASSGSCDSTSPIAGLTGQIVNQLGAMGYSFRSMDGNLVHCSGCVLQNAAADALEKVATAKGDYITVNSAFRSSAEQYILYQWYQNGQCSISLAAVPGDSNHEGGRAIDTSYYNYWLDTMQAYGWTWSYPDSDPVHFDYLSADDIRTQNLQAFQTIWNNNNPGNQLAVDGQYGPDTAAALAAAPCGGW